MMEWLLRIIMFMGVFATVSSVIAGVREIPFTRNNVITAALGGPYGLYYVLVYKTEGRGL